MRVQLVKQTEQQSIYIVYNNDDKPVGRLDKPRFITGDEAMGLAFRFQEQHPGLFPGYREACENFDKVFPEKRTK